jgi:hypothetical protein
MDRGQLYLAKVTMVLMEACKSMKLCTKCNQSKPLDQFGQHSKMKDGLRVRCKPCNNEDSRQYGQSHVAEHNAYSKLWKQRNPEKHKLNTKKDNLKRREAIRQWYRDNKEQHWFLRQVWISNNKEKHLLSNRIHTAKRRAAQLKATPIWLTQEHLDMITKIYTDCPKGFEVDHIIPLLGKEVRGLHVPWNLQAIPMPENRAKNNKVLL